MSRLVGSLLSLTAISISAILLLAAMDESLDQAPSVLRRDDGGWVEIRGNDEDIRDFDADGKLKRRIYSDLSGVRHTVEYDSTGAQSSRVRTE